MSILTELETMPQVVAYRQEYLRELAARPVKTSPGGSIRRRTGHALVRLGLWIEGLRPDEQAAGSPALQATPRGLAGNTR